MINPKNVVIKLSIFLFIILLLYLIEGACFRLVDKYAIWNRNSLGDSKQTISK